MPRHTQTGDSVVPDELLQSTNMTESEIKTELAVALFQRDGLTLGQAAILANLQPIEFQRLLASRRTGLTVGDRLRSRCDR